MKRPEAFVVAEGIMDHIIDRMAHLFQIQKELGIAPGYAQDLTVKKLNLVSHTSVFSPDRRVDLKYEDNHFDTLKPDRIT